MEQYRSQHTPLLDNAFFIIEILMDIMYADIVLQDRCASCTGNALIAKHGPTLRELVSSRKLPFGLKKAIETYCIRHCLSCAPELILTAPSAMDGILQLAKCLQNEHHETPVRPSTRSSSDKKEEDVLEPMKRIGESIIEDTMQLKKSMDIERHKHLIGALGEVILRFIFQAAAECEHEDRDSITQGRTDSNPMLETHGQAPLFMQSIQRFVKSVVDRRRCMKQLHEVELTKTANELLFPESEETTTAPANCGAHSTPRKSRERHPRNAEATPPQRKTTPSKTHTDNLKKSGLEEAVANGNAAMAWTNHHDMPKRTYFLCVETNRFEPIVNRGLF
ncbi:unnamed protein product [Phytomonas sp. Hart1]|nr:unnamed protein product [Phytomonas sp. Hart1]|eukprot:CCW70957.1 unnamed protein product [Phytomonas sp. isolate Hart1]